MKNNAFPFEIKFTVSIKILNIIKKLDRFEKMSNRKSQEAITYTICSGNGPILHELTLRDVLLLQKFVDYKLMAKSQLYFALVVNRLSMHF